MTDQEKLAQIQVDVAVTREKVSMIEEDLREIKLLAVRVREMENFASRVKAWGMISWAIFIGTAGVLARKIFG